MLRRWEKMTRLASGLVMAVFVVMHLINHALGVFSFQAMEWFRRWIFDWWGTPPAQVLLYGAILVHFSLALMSLYRRRTLRMPAWEAVQLITGLSVPLLLASHVIGTRGAVTVSGIDPDYYYVMTTMVSSPRFWLRQTVLLVIVWIHVCVGIHFWLRIRKNYRHWLPVYRALAVLVPALSLAGFAAAAFRVLEWMQDAEIRRDLLSVYKDISRDDIALFRQVEWLMFAVVGISIAGVLVARWIRRARQSREGGYRILHSNGNRYSAIGNQTLLEALRNARVPHTSVCGGRARCTTCRVRVGQGLEELPPPSKLEQAALERIGADPNVRLACQTRPKADVSITPMVSAQDNVPNALGRSGSQGREQPVVAIFVDLRGSTKLGEERLPYDVVFILNRFNAELASALKETDGHYSQFTGDGLLALYGIHSGVRKSSREALAGISLMLSGLERLNEQLREEFGRDLRMGVGAHSGSAIVGHLGPPGAPVLTAIGDTINTAARLESMTKEMGCDVIISAELANSAAIESIPVEKQRVNVRGREQGLEVYAFSNAGFIDWVAKLDQ